MRHRSLKVYYGVFRLNKIQKKPGIAIWYENGNNNPDKNLRSVRRQMDIVYTRNQTDGEMKDAKNYNRMFTGYSYFVDEKPWYGNVDKALQHNFEAECNNVNEKTRKEIWNKLRQVFYSAYNRKPFRGQFELEFNNKK